MMPRKSDRGRGHDGQHEAQAGRAENGRMGSLHALLTRYPDERSCERRLMEVRWPEGWECERCGCATC